MLNIIIGCCVLFFLVLVILEFLGTLFNGHTVECMILLLVVFIFVVGPAGFSAVVMTIVKVALIIFIIGVIIAMAIAYDEIKHHGENEENEK